MTTITLSFGNNEEAAEILSILREELNMNESAIAVKVA